MFITRQLKGLEDTKSAQFNRYFYLLEVRTIVFHHVEVCIVESLNIGVPDGVEPTSTVTAN